jgi:hypothetical protein
MKRQIEVSVDVFAAIWAQRLPSEPDEDAILARILKARRRVSTTNAPHPVAPEGHEVLDGGSARTSRPRSKKWSDVLVWTLTELGGRASLSEIYKKSREGRIALGMPITPEHDASARECLEAHCRESKKFRGKADLFVMPEGKGSGVWALRKHVAEPGVGP